MLFLIINNIIPSISSIKDTSNDFFFDICRLYGEDSDILLVNHGCEYTSGIVILVLGFISNNLLIKSLQSAGTSSGDKYLYCPLKILINTLQLLFSLILNFFQYQMDVYQ